MVPLGVPGDGLLGPLEAGGQEPGEGEDDPPHAGGHGEEVDEDEHEAAKEAGGAGLEAGTRDQLIVVARGLKKQRW